MPTSAQQRAAAIVKQRLAQQRAAIKTANEMRTLMRDLKLELKSTTVDPWQLLRGNVQEWEPVVRRMRVESALMAVPGIGKATAHEVMVEFGANPSTRMEAFSYEQRAELATIAQGVIATTPEV
jgi:hypothetical protein